MKKPNGYSKAFTLVIVFFWIVMVGLLIKKTSFDSPESSFKDLASANAEEGDPFLGEEWMGIYVGENKVGYSVSTIKKSDDVYIISQRTHMKLTVMGTPQKIDTHTYSILDPEFSAKSFLFNLQSGVVRFQAEAEVVGNEMKLIVDSGGRKIQKRIPLKGPLYLHNSLRFLLMKQGLSVGKVFNVPLFDPSTMSHDTTTVTVEGRESIEVGPDEKILAYRLKESFKGVDVRVWVDEEGRTLKEESPMGMMLVSETREEALKDDGALNSGIDIITWTAVPVDKPIKRPELATYLRMKLKGVSLGDFNLTRHRQKLEGEILEITKEQINAVQSAPIPFLEKDLDKYLESTPFIQSNDAKIIETAQKITGNGKDSLHNVQKITRWVHETIRKRPTMSIPSALEVLKLKVGDCNEHTTLFTALTRAIGIPTKMITGIVFFEKNFYYHAWAEVYLGKWISVDPTMNQFPADATHIAFVEGGLDKQVEMMKVIGNLKAEILEYR